MRTALLAALAASALFTGTAMAGDPSPPPPGADSQQQAGNPADDMTLLLDLTPDQRPALDDFLRASTPPSHGD